MNQTQPDFKRCARLLSLVFLCSTLAHAGGAPESVSGSHKAMGTEFELTVYARDADTGPAALMPLLDDVFAEIDRIEDTITTWRPESPVSYVNRHAAESPVRVEPDVVELIRRSREFFDSTHGAFDCTVGPLFRLYGFYDKQGHLPSETEIAEALARIGMDKVRIDPAKGTIAFDRPGVELDFGGIGKGFAIDRAIEILKDRGVTRALLHGGTSTVYALGTPPGEDGWKVRVRHPYNPDSTVATVFLRDASLSTSGCYGDLPEVDGVRICNIFDPRTGLPRHGMLSATAIAPTATETDALSTAFLVMGVDETRAYRARFRSVSAILVPESPGEEIAPVWIGDGEPPWNHGSTK